MKMINNSRIVSNTNPFNILVNSIVNVDGIIIGISNKNPYTKSKNKIRNKRYILTGTIAGYNIDHFWIFSKRNFDNFNIGDKINFTAKLRIYSHNGKYKYGVYFPYKLVIF